MRRQLRVSHRMLDVSMPHIVLNGPCIMAIIGQLVATGMTQHVWVDWESDLSLIPGSGDQLTDRAGRQRPLTFGNEDIGRTG